MMAPINVTTSKQQITASVADDKITANVSAGFGAVGPSGVVNVTAPITNSGTTTSANVGISIGSGLSVSSGSLIVTPNTYATLVDGKIPAGQLPSYVDDVVEVATFGSLPSPGEQGKIYLVTQTNKVYRWTGFVWLEIVASPGSTDSIAEGNVNLYYTNTRAAAAAPVQSVAGRTGTVVLAAGDIASGTLSASRLPIAAAGTLGAVRIGSGISIDGSGVISASSAYTLPVAGSSTLGGVKVNGNGVSIDGNGVLSVSTNYAATSHSHGTLTSDGKLGTVSGQIVVTGSGGLVGTASSITPGQVVTETTYTNFLPEGGSLATAFSGIDGELTARALAADFDQGLKTTSEPTFAGLTVNGFVATKSAVNMQTATGGFGSGFVFNADAGVLIFPDGSQQTAAYTGKIGTTSGLVLKTGTDGVIAALAQGTAGQVLWVNAGATAAEWHSLTPSDIGASSLGHAHSATADLTFAGATAGQVLTVNSGATALVWATPTTYTLPQATNSTLGGITVSTGLSVSSGALSVSYGTSSGTACQGNDSRLSDSRTPSGSAGGDLTGTYPNPTIANGAVTLAKTTGIQKAITSGTAAPTGGSDGDIYLQY